MIAFKTNSNQALLLIVVACTLLLSACNRGKSKTEFIDSAQGVWRSGCQNLGIDSEYGQVTLDVREATFEFTNTFYLDPQCTRATVQYLSAGELTKHDNLINDGLFLGANIDFLINQVSAEVLSDAKQAQYNTNAVCALTNWEVGVNVDISNCEDILGTAVPRTEYDIYDTAVKANSQGNATHVLYTGQVRGLSADERPSAPDLQNPYWRIGEP